MMHGVSGMSRKMGQIPRSYEEIVRKTVVDPDSSVRPTLEQERISREGYRALDAEEQALLDRVRHALVAAGEDAADVTIEVSRDLVTLRGRVADTTLLRILEDAVARVSGVSTIHDQIVVVTHRAP
jgi:osmotically-inducible protein OsmY